MCIGDLDLNCRMVNAKIVFKFVTEIVQELVPRMSTWYDEMHGQCGFCSAHYFTAPIRLLALALSPRFLEFAAFIALIPVRVSECRDHDACGRHEDEGAEIMRRRKKCARAIQA